MPIKSEYIIKSRKMYQFNKILEKYYSSPSSTTDFYLYYSKHYIDLYSFVKDGEPEWHKGIFDSVSNEEIGWISEFQVPKGFLFEVEWKESVDKDRALKITQVLINTARTLGWVVIDHQQATPGQLPWEIITEKYGWEQLALKLWHEKKTAQEISKEIGLKRGLKVSSRRVLNVLSDLRKEYSEDIVPYDRDRRKM